MGSPASSDDDETNNRESVDTTEKVVIVAGSYDGVLIGWEQNNNDEPKLQFALPTHDSSVRSLSISSSPNNPSRPECLLSCGYDESLHLYNLGEYKEIGQIKASTEGTPLCSAFHSSTHCLIGFSSGKISIFETERWDALHVLSGHTDGVSCISIHPSGKMALSGGIKDHKIMLWDLMKGRLAFVYKLPKRGSVSECVECIRWSEDGSAFGYCYGNSMQVKDVATGAFSLHTALPSKINEFCFLRDRRYVACGCNDGALALLCTAREEEEGVVRGIMAIEPVDGVIAREERIKSIHPVRSRDGTRVVTANSSGVISVLDLAGAMKIIDMDTTNSPSDRDSDDDDEQAAVQILHQVKIGSGARITGLAVWSHSNPSSPPSKQITPEEKSTQENTVDEKPNTKRKHHKNDIVMDDRKVEKARDLIRQAKKRQRKQKKKKDEMKS